MLRIAASRGFSEELAKYVIRSFHGHCTPSLKISCKSVQPLSRNLANKETNKQRNKERNRSKTIPRPPIYRGRGNNLRTSWICANDWYGEWHILLFSAKSGRDTYQTSPRRRLGKREKTTNKLKLPNDDKAYRSQTCLTRILPTRGKQ